MPTQVVIADSSIVAPVTTDSWLQDTLALLPGITRAVAKRELVLACREFYERSYAWQHTIESQDIVAGRTQYRLLTSNTLVDVVQVLGVALDGLWMPPSTERPRQPSPETNDSGDRPVTFYLGDTPDGVELYPDPTAADVGALSFKVALTIKESSEDFPRLAQQVHYDAILSGFLSRVYGHPSKPYSSPMQQAAQRRMFNAAVARWRARAKAGYSLAPSWRFPRGWSK